MHCEYSGQAQHEACEPAPVHFEERGGGRVNGEKDSEFLIESKKREHSYKAGQVFPRSVAMQTKSPVQAIFFNSN